MTLCFFFSGGDGVQAAHGFVAYRQHARPSSQPPRIQPIRLSARRKKQGQGFGGSGGIGGSRRQSGTVLGEVGSTARVDAQYSRRAKIAVERCPVECPSDWTRGSRLRLVRVPQLMPGPQVLVAR